MGRGIYPNRGMFGDAAVKNALCICAAPCGSGVHAPQHFLYFLPLPQRHGSFLPIFGVALLIWEDNTSRLRLDLLRRELLFSLGPHGSMPTFPSRPRCRRQGVDAGYLQA